MRPQRIVGLALFLVLCLSALCFGAQPRPATAQSGTDDTTQADNQQDSGSTVSKLVYTKANLLDSAFSIYIADPDGSNVIRLTKDAERATFSSLSPDGTKIAYIAGTAAGPRVYVMDTNGGNKHPVSSAHSLIGAPGWSPDSTQIIYYAVLPATQGGKGLYLINVDGTNETHINMDDSKIVFPDIALNSPPKWSPDGNHILFLAQPGTKVDNSGSLVLYIMNPDGSKVTRVLEEDPQLITAAAWSPDGSKFVFADETSLFTIDADLSNAQTLTSLSDDFIPFQIAWSPDGTQLAMSAVQFQPTKYALYVFTLDSQDFQKISDDNNIFGLSWGLVPEELVPTIQPTIKPTATRTPIPTRTPRPTLTPRPTVTPRPTKTARPTLTPKPSSTPTA